MGTLVERAAKAEAALDEQEKAQATKDAAEAERLGRLKVNVVSASGAVDEDNKPVARGELSVAAARLIDVKPDPQELVDAALRKQLVAEGRMTEAQSAYGLAVSDASAKAAEIGKLNEALSVARQEASNARRVAQDAVQHVADALADVDRQIKDAVTQEDARIASATRAWQVNAANWAGGICGGFTLVCLAGVFILPVTASLFKRGAAISGMLCLACFGFARFVASSWFMPVIIFTLGLSVIFWVIYEFRLSFHKNEANVASVKAKAVVTYAAKLVDVINEVDKTATAEDKPGIKKLFERIKTTSSANDDIIRHDLETFHATSLAQSEV
jgi:hypothetical protein